MRKVAGSNPGQRLCSSALYNLTENHRRRDIEVFVIAYLYQRFFENKLKQNCLEILLGNLFALTSFSLDKISLNRVFFFVEN